MTLGIAGDRPGSASVRQAFDLSGRVAIITGGGGLLGRRHGEAVAELGGTAILVDVNGAAIDQLAEEISASYDGNAVGLVADITSRDAIAAVRDEVLGKFGSLDILINNAANNPKMEALQDDAAHWSRFESFPLDLWHQDIAVGLTGAFLCSQIFGTWMAWAGKGVILNIASDLGVIAPDQRIYRSSGESEEKQSVKPVTYSVVKTGLIGLTRYLATYWPRQGVRANALAPGGVYTSQDEAFVARLTNLIPMGRMAHDDEYKSAVAFMISDASSYMNGAVINIDGGRTAW